MKIISVIVALILFATISYSQDQDTTWYIVYSCKKSQDSAWVANMKNFAGTKGLRYHFYSDTLATLLHEAYEVTYDLSLVRERGFLPGSDILGDTTKPVSVLIKESLPFHPIW